MNRSKDEHRTWTDRLSDYMDGGLTVEDHAEVESHLAECADCRRVLEELRDVAARARALGPVEPARDLWTGIAATIEAPAPTRASEGARVIELPTAGRAGEREEKPSRRRGLTLTSPQLAAASVALIALSSWATWSLRPVPETPSAAGASVERALLPASNTAPPAPDLARELASLEEAVVAARGRLDPNTLRVLERNLGIIEQAIAESQRALAQDPENDFLQEHLQRVYQRKAEFLRDAARAAERAG